MTDHAVILLVEDRTDDVLLIRRSFEKAHVSNPLHVVTNGEEAVAYVSGEGKYSSREEYPLPHLILLDLKMPKMDGFEFIRWVRTQPGLAGIPIVVLTASDQMRDVNEAYKLGANSFLVKPLDFQNFVELGHLIREYWIKTARVSESFRPPPRVNPKNP